MAPAVRIVGAAGAATPGSPMAAQVCQVPLAGSYQLSSIAPLLPVTNRFTW
jgi:hypothetical protein